eukprot:CAMPEP_0117740308 /NCGR_PEP_ID=MMETSP0947-20121206/4267_1 /TAXON_ID=44440 /ORGANISM="Chattonella subsalsa, Strain CCMP2191" /LENGTH=121 /DNA_ID=CAMNT_0005556403 /DNA_START=109 /DNA_END=471 /DNA_ORIENTATION=-
MSYNTTVMAYEPADWQNVRAQEFKAEIEKAGGKPMLDEDDGNFNEEYFAQQLVKFATFEPPLSINDSILDMLEDAPSALEGIESTFACTTIFNRPKLSPYGATIYRNRIVMNQDISCNRVY